jgi:hypothetical protein
MPVESAPTLRSVHTSVPAIAPPPICRLTRSDLAPSDVVEPLLQTARGSVASLQLKARAAEQKARASEAALVGDAHGVGGDFPARRAERLAVVELEVQTRRRMRDAALDEARREAEVVLNGARDDGWAVIAAAREELDRSLSSLPGAAPLPTLAAPIAATIGVGAVLTSGPREPDPSPRDPEPSFPPPAAGPSYPPPSAGPTLPPPMMAAPFGGSFAPTFTTVLVQAPDGTLQQMLMLTPGGFAAPAAAPVAPVPVAMPALMPAAAGATNVVMAPAAPATVAPPAPAIPVQEAGAAQPSAARRLLHLDVILPLLAVAIVLVVLLAWLG